MMDADCVIFFFGGDGLNSSRNLEVLVSATLFLRASGAGTANSDGLIAWPVTVARLVRPCRLAGLGVSSLSVGKEAERRGRRKSEDEILKAWFSVSVRDRFTTDPPKLSGGLCGRLE
jgi:hypothetical protein